MTAGQRYCLECGLSGPAGRGREYEDVAGGPARSGQREDAAASHVAAAAGSRIRRASKRTLWRRCDGANLSTTAPRNPRGQDPERCAAHGRYPDKSAAGRAAREAAKLRRPPARQAVGVASGRGYARRRRGPQVRGMPAPAGMRRAQSGASRSNTGRDGGNHGGAYRWHRRGRSIPADRIPTGGEGWDGRHGDNHDEPPPPAAKARRGRNTTV